MSVRTPMSMLISHLRKHAFRDHRTKRLMIKAVRGLLTSSALILQIPRSHSGSVPCISLVRGVDKFREMSSLASSQWRFLQHMPSETASKLHNVTSMSSNPSSKDANRSPRFSTVHPPTPLTPPLPHIHCDGNTKETFLKT